MSQAASFLQPLKESETPSSAQYSGPVSLLPQDPDLLSSRRQNQLIWTFLAVGLLARCVRYFLRFPLWEDECFLCVNFIDRGYLDLLGPLQPHQVAPVLFLWIELTMVKLFGYNELSLRLFSFICSVASLFLFRHLAGRLLSGTALVLAIGLFAVAYPGIRYAAEAKQYGSDMFVGLLLLTMTVEWWRAVSRESKTQSRWIWVMASITPFAVGVSYPAVFAAGGVSLFIVWVIWKNSTQEGQSVFSNLQSTIRNSQWRPWFCFNVILLCSFAVLLLAAKNQNSAELNWMSVYWGHTFPPLASPWKLPEWFFVIHTGDLLAYPIGGGRGASTLTFLCVLAAVALLIRSRRFTLALLLLAPPTLHFIAAALHRYPYGGHVKFSQHMSGIICLLAGVGTTVVFAWIAQRSRFGSKVFIVPVIYLMLIGVGSVSRDLSRPYKTKSDMRARAFAQWFWFNTAFEGEIACVKSDLNQDFSPATYHELSWASMYLCNKQIYSPNSGNGPNFDRVTAEWPLRCVLYKDPRFEFDDDAFHSWLEEMKSRYTLVGTETYAFPRFDKRERTLGNVDYLETYKFIPKTTTAANRMSDNDSKATSRR